MTFTTILFTLALVYMTYGSTVPSFTDRNVFGPSGMPLKATKNQSGNEARLSKRAPIPITSICTKGSLGNIALVSVAPGSGVIASGASGLCASVGLTLADVTAFNFLETADVAFQCNGPTTVSWVKSWGGNSYPPFVAMNFQTGVAATGGVIYPPAAGEIHQALCQGTGIIPKCATGRTPFLAKFPIVIQGGSPIDGFLAHPALYSLDGTTFIPSGYKNGVISSPNVAFNGFADPVNFARSTKWDASSIYITGAWNDGLKVALTGIRNGVTVFTKNVVVNTSGPSLVLLNWQNIDSVNVVTSGGTNNPAYSGMGTHAAFDDFQICV